MCTDKVAYHPSPFTLHPRQGFTLIELLIIIGLMLLIGAFSLPIGTSILLQTELDAVVDHAVSSIHRAQQNAMDEKAGATWGVCVTSDNKIRMYRGSCISPTTSTDYPIPSVVTVSGLGTITFSDQRGEPSAALTVTISTALKTKTITLNRGGGVSVN